MPWCGTLLRGSSSLKQLLHSLSPPQVFQWKQSEYRLFASSPMGLHWLLSPSLYCRALVPQCLPYHELYSVSINAYLPPSRSQPSAAQSQNGASKTRFTLPGLNPSDQHSQNSRKVTRALLLAREDSSGAPKGM